MEIRLGVGKTFYAVKELSPNNLTNRSKLFLPLDKDYEVLAKHFNAGLIKL